MSNQQQSYPYDLAEHEETEALHIVAFGKVVPNTPTFAPDETQAARQYCQVLNAAYNAGVAGRGADDATTQGDPGYNTMTRNGS